MVRILTVFSVLFLLGVSAMRADEKKPFDDDEFVKMAASGGMAEVELGKIGGARASTDGLKTFSARIVKDHTHANKELKAAAKAAGIAAPEQIDEKQQKHIDKFKNYKGDDFDRDFIKHMIKDHEQDIALFTRASTDAQHAELKAFATKALPVLKEHLEMVKKLDK